MALKIYYLFMFLFVLPFLSHKYGFWEGKTEAREEFEKEKLKNKKPKEIKPKADGWAICPNSDCCGSINLKEIEQACNDEIFYCYHCGQALIVGGEVNG